MTATLKRIWNCFRYENEEITAWMKMSVARGPETVVASLFTSTALIFLADSIDTNCDERVDLGILTLRVSSILSATAVVENVVNLFLSPYWGSLADAKSSRKPLLVFSSVLWVSSVGIGGIILFFEPSLLVLWLFLASAVITAVFYELALLLTFSYLPEVVDNEEQLTSVTSQQYAIVNALQLGAAAFLVFISLVIPEDTFSNDLPLSIMAHFFVVIIWCYYAIPALLKLPNRTSPKHVLNTKPGGAIKELIKTSRTIVREYINVAWFLLAWSFYFAGVASVTILQVAYVTEEFDYSTSDVAVLGAIVLIFSVFGALLSQKLSKRFKLKTLLLASLFFWSLVCFIAPWLLLGEELKNPIIENVTNDGSGCLESEKTERQATFFGAIFAYLFAAVVGMGVGFVYPVSTSIYSLIIPGGEESSYFGIKTFGAKVFAWAPSLVFTIINEKTDNIQIAFMSLGLWFAFSLPFVYKMNVEQGIRDVAHTLKHRQGAGKHNFDVEQEETKVGFVEPESQIDNNETLEESKEVGQGQKPNLVMLLDGSSEVLEKNTNAGKDKQENLEAESL